MAILWILINVMCTVHIGGHEANFYEAEARKSEAEAEAEWFGLEASRPRGLEALTSLLICAWVELIMLCIFLSRHRRILADWLG